MNDSEKLKNLIDKTKSLLDDPQPGLFTWNDFLNENLQELYNLLNGKGYKVK